MNEKQRIILKYFREGISLRKISKDLGLNRRTVTRYVTNYKKKLEELEKATGMLPDELLDEISSKPKYDISTRSKRKIKSELLEEIQKLLDLNKKRRLSGQHKQQLKKIDIYELIIDKGFSIGYSSVCNAVNKLVNKSKEAFIRQEYNVGDVCEFDWGTVKIYIGEQLTTYQMALFTSGFSNYRYAYLFKHQDTRSFQQSHVYFVAKIGGVYKTFVYDNMRVAVKKFVGPTEERATEGLLKLSMYYNFDFRFCNVRKGNEKGHVERSVEYVRRKAFAHKEHFETLEEANIYLENVCDKLNNKPKKERENKSSFELLQEEKSFLFENKLAFECSEILTLKVDKYSTISYKTSHYSAPDNLVGKMITVRVYPERISLSYNDTKLCTHIRRSGFHEWSIKLEHYLETLERKPGALKGSLALHQSDNRLKVIYKKYYLGREKEFIELLDYVGCSKLSLEKLEEIILYIKPFKSTELTLDKIKIINEREDDSKIVSNNTSEIEILCKKQLNELSELIPDVSNMNCNMAEVL